jgi:hypothetical protein
MLTNCVRCNKPFTEEQYERLDYCPSCGKNFAEDSYMALISLVVILSLLGWLAHWWSPSGISKKGASLVTGALVCITVFGIGIDKFMAMTMSRHERGQKAFWIAGIITLAIFYFLRPYIG